MFRVVADDKRERVVAIAKEVKDWNEDELTELIEAIVNINTHSPTQRSLA
jgi:hypothetical protein